MESRESIMGRSVILEKRVTDRRNVDHGAASMTDCVGLDLKPGRGVHSSRRFWAPASIRVLSANETVIQRMRDRLQHRPFHAMTRATI